MTDDIKQLIAIQQAMANSMRDLAQSNRELAKAVCEFIGYDDSDDDNIMPPPVNKLEM